MKRVAAMQKTKTKPPQALRAATAPLERPLLPVEMELGSMWSEGDGVVVEWDVVVVVEEEVGDSEAEGVSLGACCWLTWGATPSGNLRADTQDVQANRRTAAHVLARSVCGMWEERILARLHARSVPWGR